jgi:hypothetical protein
MPETCDRIRRSVWCSAVGAPERHSSPPGRNLHSHDGGHLNEDMPSILPSAANITWQPSRIALDRRSDWCMPCGHSAGHKFFKNQPPLLSFLIQRLEEARRRLVVGEYAARGQGERQLPRRTQSFSYDEPGALPILQIGAERKEGYQTDDHDAQTRSLHTTLPKTQFAAEWCQDDIAKILIPTRSFRAAST